MSDIDLLIEAERRGILPEDKVPLLAEARRRGLVPGGKLEGGSEPDRQLRRFRHQLTFGLADPILDRANAVVRTMGGGTYGENLKREQQLTAAALRNDRGAAGTTADVVTDTAALTGQAVATAPLFMVKTGGQMMQGGFQAGRELIEQLVNPNTANTVRTATGADLAINQLTRTQMGREAGGAGAGFGAASGYGQGDGSAGDVLKGAGGGYLVGRAIPGAMNAFEDYVRAPLRAARTRGAERANAAAREFDEAGVPVPGVHALTDSPTVQSTAESLSGTMFGAHLRAANRASIEAVEQRVQETIARAGGARTPAQAGEEQQAFLRQQLTERSTPTEQVRQMTPEQLQDATGVGPGPQWAPEPPPVPPVAPEYRPVTPDEYLRGVAEGVPEVPPRAVVEPQMPPMTAADVPVPEVTVRGIQQANDDYAAAQQRYGTLRQQLDDVERAGWQALDAAGYQTAHPAGPGLPPGTIALSPKGGGPAVYVFPDNRVGVINRDKVLRQAAERSQRNPDPTSANPINSGSLDIRAPLSDAEMAAVEAVRRGNATSHRDLIAAQREMAEFAARRDRARAAMDQYRQEQLPFEVRAARRDARRTAEAEARAEASRATQAARDAEVERHRPVAEYEARHQTEKRRLNAEEEARKATEARQRFADERHAEDIAARRAAAERPFEMGRSSESYPTEFDMAFEQVSRNTPPRQAELLDPGTETTGLIRALGHEARRTLQLPGWKPSDGLTPELLNELRPRIGDDLAEALRRYSQPGFKPGIQGLHDIRTMIGSRLGDARAAGRTPGQPRDYDEALLARMYDAVSDDLTMFMRTTSRPGTTERAAGEFAAGQHEQVRGAYRDYVQNLRRPLSTIFGDRVTPEQAIGRLTEAAGNGAGANMTLLRAFYRVADDKGDRLLATNAILHRMSEGGMEGFLRAYRGLSQDARDLMFQGTAREYGRALDRLARVGSRLERHARTAREDGSVDLTRATRPGNMSVAALAYFLNLPSAVAGALGASGLSRLMASRRFVEWIRTAPQAIEQGNAVTWRRHGARLRAIITTELGGDEAAADTIIEAVAGGQK